MSNPSFGPLEELFAKETSGLPQEAHNKFPVRGTEIIPVYREVDL
jgi:hypothetical protein